MYQFIEPQIQPIHMPIRTEPMLLPVIAKGQETVKPIQNKKIELGDIMKIMDALNNDSLFKK